ncbi:MAG: hypothetical protein AB1758_28555, partial [Candidatus Eremiobacterota bacterium]
MLDWLKRLTGGVGLKNRAGLSPTDLNLLQAYLGPLDKLASRSLRYVVDGDGEDVLDALRGTPGAGAALQLLALSSRGLPTILPRHSKAAHFLERPKCDDAGLYLRLARLLAAAAERDFKGPSAYPARLLWLSVFLFEATDFHVNVWPQRFRDTWPAALFVRMLALAGEPPDWLLKPLLSATGSSHDAQPLMALTGLGDLLATHRELLAEPLSGGKAADKVLALERMAKLQAFPPQLVESVLDAALSKARTVREAARAVLKHYDCRESLRRRALRPDAVELMAWLYPDEREFLTSLPDPELEQAARRVLPALEERLELPPVPAANPDAPLPGAVLDDLKGISAGLRERPDPKVMFEWLQRGVFRPDLKFSGWTSATHDNKLYQTVLRMVARPEFLPVHLVRYLVASGTIRLDRDQWWLASWLDALADHHRRTHPPGMTLREFAAAFQAVGLDPALLGRAKVIDPFGPRLDWEPPAIWPYFAEHLDVLELALELRPGEKSPYYWDRASSRRRTLEVLRHFPRLPGSLVEALWVIALEGPRPDR